MIMEPKPDLYMIMDLSRIQRELWNRSCIREQMIMEPDPYLIIEPDLGPHMVIDLEQDSHMIMEPKPDL